MKRVLTIFSILALCGAGAEAQKFKVESVMAIKTGAPEGVFHPVFTPDGKSLLVTAEDYTGLGIVDLNNTEYRQLSDMAGAGYKAAISDDGSTVIVRKNNIFEQTMDVYAIDVQTAQPVQLMSDMEHINTLTMNQGALNYATQGKLQCVGVATNRLKAQTKQLEDVFVTEEDLKIVVYRNGEPTVVDPLSTPENDVNYCWTVLSPDKTKIAFVAGQNAYTCNLDGTNLKNLGNLRAPKWRDNNYVVGMNDSDNGHEFIASDIVIVGADGSDYQQLTTKSDEIKMFPDVSADGNRIAYHTTEGNIYIMTIAEK